MNRLFDVLAIAAVAIVFLLPKASLEAKPALEAATIERDRVAELEDRLFTEPDNTDTAVALADAYLRLLHPDWALAVTERFAARGDHRVHLVRATAHAERLEATACLAETGRGLAACDSEGTKCPPGDRVRFGVISSAMQVLVDQKIDPRKDPRRAREAVAGVLHTTRASAQQK